MQTEAGLRRVASECVAGPRRRRRRLRRDPLRPRAAPRARAHPRAGGRGGQRRVPRGRAGWPREAGHRIRVDGAAHRDAARGQEPRDRRARGALPRRRAWSGFDIAGAEAGFPPTRHLDAFEYLRRENAHFTIHAGEAFGLPSIWEAIQWCGADRLGHGVRIVDDIRRRPAVRRRRRGGSRGDPADVELGLLAAYVRDRRIPLEMCPSSNVQTGAAESIGAAPDRAAHAAAVPGHGQHRQPADERHVDVPRDGACWSTRPAGRWTDLRWVTINAMKSAFLPFDERLAIIDDVVKPGYDAALAGPPWSARPGDRRPDRARR